MLNVSSWRWPHWLLLSLALLSLVSYFGLISTGGLHQTLEILAGSPEATAGVFPRDTGRAEALMMVFAFVLLAPLGAVVVAAVPLFISAIVATYINRATGVPIRYTTLLFWLVVAVVAVVMAEEWVPWVQWLGQLLARGFLIALG